MSGGRCPDPEVIERAADAAQLGWSTVDAAVSRLRVERSSPAGEVRVVVDGRGDLVDVGFSERVRTTAPDRLAALLLTALREAQGALVDAVADAAAGAGIDGDAVAGVLDGYRRRFPAVADPSPRPAPRTEGTWLR